MSPFLAVIRALAAILGHRRSTPVASPPLVAERALAVVVHAPTGQVVPYATVTFIPTGMTKAWTGVTNRDGYLVWTVPITIIAGQLTVMASDYQPYKVTVDVPPANTTICLGPPDAPGSVVRIDPLRPLPPPVAALVTRGRFFQLATGAYWTAIEATDFQLFQRFLQGEDISAVLHQRAALGFNLLRVSLTCANMFPLNPAEYLTYFDKLSEFVAVLFRAGLRPEFVVFMDAPRVMPSAASQHAFFARVLETLQPCAPQVLIELVNENDQRANTIDVMGFVNPSGFLCSRGSNGSEAWPPDPAWTYATFHTNEAFEWVRKVGHNAMEVADAQRVPVIANENTRAPDRFNSEAQAFDAAASAALLCAGSCFHSVSGKQSTLFDDAEAALAAAWVAGATSVDLRFQDGLYQHRADLETPADLRVYSRRLPTGEESPVVRIRR